MRRAPPVVWLALAFVGGAACGLAGAPWFVAPLAAPLLLFRPKATSRRPVRGSALLASAACGLLAAHPGVAGCPSPARPLGTPVAIEGRFLVSPRGGSGPFRALGSCSDVTAVVPRQIVPPDAALRVRLKGRWVEGRAGPWLRVAEVEPAQGASPGPEWSWWPVRWRDHLVERLGRLYGERAPLVAALALARREGLDGELRESFARSGIAHLLAISGFHVGVIAGGALLGLALCGVPRRRRELGAAATACAYVAFIGFPDAACRAALMLSLVALSRARGRPPARWAPLGGAILILVALDPSRLTSVGFQLSFAGVAGLTAWAGSLASTLRRWAARGIPRGITTAVAAGLAATLATVPVVAWHFGRISLVGVPVTLAATPLVTLALAGSLATLAIDFVWPGLALFLAGGVSVVLAALEAVARTSGSWLWATAWTTKPSVAAACAGVALATWLARRPRIRGRARRGLVTVYALSGVLAWPLALAWQGRRSTEVVMIDVGQGDAIAVRTPGGRWLLVDAGPPHDSDDPEAHPVVRALRARGVRRLEALILTHPDLDHIGGGPSVLDALDVGVVYDPGLPAGKDDFVAVLDAATRGGVPWRSARAGDRIALDGVLLEVLHPPDSLAGDSSSNETSVVLHLRFGEFDALLTGDAYKDVERAIVPETEPLEVLKVGHHGSDTSTDPLLLERLRPELALISVGRGNRYGHPSPAVLDRLEASGARVRRTDLEGTLSVQARRDGRYEVLGSRRYPAWRPR